MPFLQCTLDVTRLELGVPESFEIRRDFKTDFRFAGVPFIVFRVVLVRIYGDSIISILTSCVESLLMYTVFRLVRTRNRWVIRSQLSASGDCERNSWYISTRRWMMFYAAH